MMPEGVEAPEGIVKSVGQPGQRVPVGRIEAEKRPLEKGGAKGAYMGVSHDVEVVIPVHESVAKSRNIRGQGYQNHQSGSSIPQPPGSFHTVPVTCHGILYS